MAMICETENFEIMSADRPFVDRREGGHIRIYPKIPVLDRTKLSPELAIEGDIDELREDIERLLSSDKYRSW